ncbi:MAG: 2-oxoglutarate and iron-dependent oxygenase domain-containing protein [Cyanobacteriota bacterium]|nr:2-oxoglutarate and iron-dependent oxygenase domain-containing protein [Cyanobacteriota bacterium]
MATAEILEVDLLAFEQGDHTRQTAVVDGVMRSLGTGFVLTRHDLPTDLLDEAYGMLGRFFALEPGRKQAFRQPEACGQCGYTGTLVETAAGEQQADWKEMLNWAAPLPEAHPLRRRFPLLYPEQRLPEPLVPGIRGVLQSFHQAIAELQRRFLRVIATGLGAHPDFFDAVVSEAPTLSRAIHYPPMRLAPGGGHLWAAAHADINLITALPRATAAGLQVRVNDDWVDAVAPEGQVIINSGLMLERLSNGRIPSGWHRVMAPEGCSTSRLSVVQFCHPRPSTLLSPLASCITPERPQRYAGVLAADALEDVLYRIKLLN